MKISVIIFCVLLIPSYTFGQLSGANFNQTGGTSENLNMALSDVMRKIKTTDNSKLYKIEGSPYLYKEWKAATMKTTRGGTVKGIQLKYNCYSSEIVGKRDESKDSVLVNDELIQAFTLQNGDGTSAHFEKFLVRSNQTRPNERVFYQVLKSGETSLLKYQLKKVRQFNQKTTSVVDTSQPRLVLEEELFFVRENGSSISLKKNNRKKALSFFGPHEQELSKFAKSNKLSLKSVEDLITLLTKYDTL